MKCRETGHSLPQGPGGATPFCFSPAVLLGKVYPIEGALFGANSARNFEYIPFHPFSGGWLFATFCTFFCKNVHLALEMAEFQGVESGS